ncbi:MAG: hypothetical protein ACXWE0_10990 [Nitrososphaeraceae archaeon]
MLCDSGDTVLSGSYVIVNAGNTGFLSYSAVNNDNGWKVTASGPSSGDGVVSLRAFVHCFDNLPLRP